MSPITYLGFGLLTLTLVAVDLWQTRGGNVTIKKRPSGASPGFFSRLSLRLAFITAGNGTPLTAATVPRKPLFFYYLLFARKVVKCR